MKTTLCAPLFYLLALSSAFCQEYNTVNGCVVTHNGDTIAGLLKDKTDMYDVISFRPNTQNGFREYSPDALLAFSYEGGYNFESLKLPDGKQAFLLKITHGKLALYQYHEVFYVKTQDGQLYELQHEADKVVDRKLIEDNRYLRVLSYLTSDCPDVKDRVEKVRYSASDLSKFLQDYNACVDPEYNNSAPDVTKLQFHLGARAGVSISSFRYLTEGSPYYRVIFTPSSNAMGGVFFNLTFKDKLSAQPEIIVSRKKAYFLGKLSNFSDDQEFRIASTFIEFPISIYYTFPTKGLRPFISLGGVAGFALNQEAVRTVHNTDLSVEVSRDVLGYKGGFGLSKVLKDRYRVALEYSVSNSFGNRNYLIQNYSWVSHEITLRTSLYLGRQKK